jgi:hypothetical protein
MSQPITPAQRRRLTFILFGLLGVTLFFAAFAPAYLAGMERHQALVVECANASANAQQLASTQTILMGQAAIAHSLGLPVAKDIDAQLNAIHIPEVTAECNALSSS